VIRALEALPPPTGGDDDATVWPLEQLVDHVVETHHAYVRSAIPTIGRYLAKLIEVHGSRHPELAAVAERFATVAIELAQHMMKEERVLFPYVVELARRAERPSQAMSPFGSIENPIKMMEREHRDAAGELTAIRRLTDNYTAPADGCTTYCVAMAELERFERDLHRHVHLENNVMFPRAIALENGVDDRG